MKRLIRTLIFFVIVACVLAGIVTGLSVTESGSRWLVNRVIKTNDIPLTVKSIEGRLVNGLTFRDLHYQEGETGEVRLGQLSLKWSATDLIGLKLNIHSLDAIDLYYKPSKQEDSDATIIFPEITAPGLPVAVEINEINLINIFLVTDRNIQLIERAKAKLVIDKSGVNLQLEELLGQQQQLTGFISLQAADKPDINIQLDWTGVIENEPAQGKFKINGSQDDLFMKVNVDSIAELDASGNFNLATTPIKINVKGQLPRQVS